MICLSVTVTSNLLEERETEKEEMAWPTVKAGIWLDIVHTTISLVPIFIQ